MLLLLKAKYRTALYNPLQTFLFQDHTPAFVLHLVLAQVQLVLHFDFEKCEWFGQKQASRRCMSYNSKTDFLHDTLMGAMGTTVGHASMKGGPQYCGMSTKTYKGKLSGGACSGS